MAGNVYRSEINDHKNISEDFLDPRILVEQGSLVQAWQGGTPYAQPFTLELYEVGVDEERHYVARYGEAGTVTGDEEQWEFELFVHDDSDAVNLASRFTDRDSHGWETDEYPKIQYDRWSWPKFAAEDEDSIIGEGAGRVAAALDYGRALEEVRKTFREEQETPQYLSGDVPSFAGKDSELIGHPGFEAYDLERFQVHRAAPRKLTALLGRRHGSGKKITAD